jgi:hypothetical protein
MYMPMSIKFYMSIGNMTLRLNFSVEWENEKKQPKVNPKPKV